ncbi:type II toxin-antitoxin system VapC family toxin [Methylobacterium sp. J-030]|uniref:type II toxin-antitoxin system VapC family toxin n=1 Tax=Methylobacterium sp. J-030 TaxID=2836627 RepID=UPI001FB90F27|nr:type II toxin-antitoxin system VapC family toxin [Methylobacterium sp. J-030]MCJ2068065.1 type II toxin-antitoxin system VapC family toxin [Methylobacterium sp. J-030]
MIVLDSSAFIAIQRAEPEAEQFSRLLSLADIVVMAAATYLECAIVAARVPNGRAVLDAWIAARRISIVPVDHTLAQIAADAFARYGKGRHPAGLNFGDCFAYALARSLNAPLLFKGADFSRTDVMRAA